MKHLFIKLNLCALLVFLNLSSSAQPLSVIPSQATTDDSISVIADVIFNKYGCRLDSFSIKIIDSTIIIDANYIVGFGNASCQTIDTIMIGKLDPKRYKLKYNVIYNYPPYKSAFDSIYFTVDQVIGITEHNNPIQSVSVYPNPSKNQFYVESNSNESQELELLDITGKIILQQTFLNKTLIDVKNLNPTWPLPSIIY